MPTKMRKTSTTNSKKEEKSSKTTDAETVKKRKKATTKKVGNGKKLSAKSTKKKSVESTAETVQTQSTKVSLTNASASLFGLEPYKEKPNEEYMNQQQRNHFREILSRWKKVLMEEVDRTVHHMQDGVMRHPDPSDNATQEEEFTLELRARDRERKLLRKIDEALNRIEQDEYGFCEICGIEIGIRRLEARPTAEMCIDCKTLAEIKEKQIRA